MFFLKFTDCFVQDILEKQRVSENSQFENVQTHDDEPDGRDLWEFPKRGINKGWSSDQVSAELGAQVSR